MAKCIFCEAELNASTKPEHILLELLGGRKATTRTTCTAHNELFGKTIDRMMPEQVQHLRNMLQMESGSGKPPPQLRNVQSVGGPVHVGSDGLVKPAGVPFEITELPDGSKSVQIMVRTEGELAKILPDIAGILKMPVEQLKAQIAAKAQVRSVTKRPDQVKFELRIGGDGLRSAVKSLITLWAADVARDEVRGNVFSAAREFVLNGGQEFVSDHVQMDSRYIPQLDDVIKRFGPFFNLIYVRSDSAGRVVGHFTLYNMLAWQFELAPSGATPNKKACIVSNPLDPVIWSDEPSDLPEISLSWLDEPDYLDDDFVRARARLEAMMNHYFTEGAKAEFDRIRDEVLAKHEWALSPAVIKEVTARWMAYSTGKPYEEVWSKDDIEGLLKKVKS